jgi:hypothetical protein
LPVQVVPGTGIEPVRLAARDFESRASTYSAIPATRRALSLICPAGATLHDFNDILPVWQQAAKPVGA